MRGDELENKGKERNRKERKRKKRDHGEICGRFVLLKVAHKCST